MIIIFDKDQFKRVFTAMGKMRDYKLYERFDELKKVVDHHMNDIHISVSIITEGNKIFLKKKDDKLIEMYPEFKLKDNDLIFHAISIFDSYLFSDERNERILRQQEILNGIK